MKARAQAVIRLSFPSEGRSKIVLRALEPETKITPTHRSRVQIREEDKGLILIFKARDTSALRAAINSYLRWIALVNDACSILESL